MVIEFEGNTTQRPSHGLGLIRVDWIEWNERWKSFIVIFDCIAYPAPGCGFATADDCAFKGQVLHDIPRETQKGFGLHEI